MAKEPNEERDELRRTRTWSARVESDTERSTEEPNPQPNPDLEQFKKDSAEFNARVHQALAEIPVPPNLREQILARSKIIPLRPWVRWRREPRLLAIAAAFILLGSLAALWLKPAGEDLTFAGFRSRMVGFAIRQYSMDLHTNQLAAVRTYLADNGAPADFPLPAALAARPVMGGAKLSWQGKPVGMVCFAAPAGKTLYMFVINSAHAPGTGPAVDLSTQKNLSTATWQSGDKTFLVAGEVPLQDLETLVKS